MSDGERLRMVCTDLGTTFIKIGQMVSTRTELVGDDVAEALSTLHHASARRYVEGWNVGRDIRGQAASICQPRRRHRLT
jgi:hypothetical protein